MAKNFSQNAQIPDTYFAPAARASTTELNHSIKAVSSSPVVEGLLSIVQGVLAVLNEQRQIVTVNDALLRMLGVKKPEEVIGLRPGEALHCIHANEAPGGCGTGQYCASCGAAIAIVASLESNQAADQKCIASVIDNGIQTDLCLKVSSVPISLKGSRFLLLFLNDITQNERWAALERAFLHDISNIVFAIRGTCDFLSAENAPDLQPTIEKLKSMSRRLAKEVDIQRLLCQMEYGEYRKIEEIVTVDQILSEIRDLLDNHTITNRKQFIVENRAGGVLKTDPTLLLRILTNMLINAFEATPKGGKVQLSITRKEKEIIFSVWNQTSIPENIAGRIFQRYFTTKKGVGRGLGTYSIKLFGEKHLGGKVGFQSSKKKGTTFYLSLPE